MVKEMSEEELEEARKQIDGPDPLDAAFEEVGVTTKDVAQVIKDALTAEHVEVAKYQGVIGDEKSYVDHRTRLEGAKEFARLQGLYPAETRKLEGDLTVSIINYADKKEEEDEG